MGGKVMLTPLFVLCAESPMKYAGMHENDFTAHG
jgi:hypothetical protein